MQEQEQEDNRLHYHCSFSSIHNKTVLMSGQANVRVSGGTNTYIDAHTCIYNYTYSFTYLGEDILLVPQCHIHIYSTCKLREALEVLGDASQAQLMDQRAIRPKVCTFAGWVTIMAKPNGLTPDLGR